MLALCGSVALMVSCWFKSLAYMFEDKQLIVSCWWHVVCVFQKFRRHRWESRWTWLADKNGRIYIHVWILMRGRSCPNIFTYGAAHPVKLCYFVSLFVCWVIFQYFRSKPLDCSAWAWTTMLSPGVASILAAYLRNTRLRDPHHPSQLTAKHIISSQEK